MSFILSSIVAFLIALGILVTVHEFGHFWVARKLGVKVLRFSVGFGKPLLRFQRAPESTEYVLAAIPLGGYVKMLDEREGEVPAEEKHLAFNTQSVWTRIAIVCAGPFANVVLAVLFYTIVFSTGIPDRKPIIGDVEPNSIAAAAGFENQDEIVAIAKQPISTWQQVRLAFLDQLLAEEEFSVTVRTSMGSDQQRYLNLTGHQLLKQEGDILQNIGLNEWWPTLEPIIDELTPGQAAERAGLHTGDRVLQVNDISVSSWSEWAKLVRQYPEQAIVVLVDRDGERLEIEVIPASYDHGGKIIGRVGATPLVTDNFKKQVDDLRVLVKYPLHSAFVKAFVKSWQMSVRMFKMIGELITGGASLKNVSGPITIADYAGKSARISISYYIDLIAFISISLAVLNILPIPLLDGGHLLNYIIELIKGSPVSEQVEALGQRIGIVLLACLMSLALYNDITRLLR